MIENFFRFVERTDEELAELSYEFERRYQVEILYPLGLEVVAREWWANIYKQVLDSLTQSI